MLSQPASEESNNGAVPVDASSIPDFSPEDFQRSRQLELHLRSLFAKGIPLNAPCCQYHREKLDELDHALEISGNEGNIDTQLAAAASVFYQTVTSETALLPFCDLCLKAEWAINPREVPMDVDFCTCATSIHDSDCWYCALDLVQTEKIEQMKKRMRKVPARASGPGMVRLELACECGFLASMPEKARKCVGCNGLVTVEFKNYAGAKVAFRFASVNLMDRGQVGIPSSSNQSGHLLGDDNNKAYALQYDGTYPPTYPSPEHSAPQNRIFNHVQDAHGGARSSTKQNPRNLLPGATEVQWDVSEFDFSADQFKTRSSSDEHAGDINSILDEELQASTAVPADALISLQSAILMELPKDDGRLTIFTQAEYLALARLGLYVLPLTTPLDTKNSAMDKLELVMRENVNKEVTMSNLVAAFEVCGVTREIISPIVDRLLEKYGRKLVGENVLAVIKEKGWLS